MVMIMVTKVTYYGLFLEKEEGSHSFLDYLGYCFYFPSVFAGPTFPFPLYLRFIYKQEQYRSITFDTAKIFTPLLVSIPLVLLAFQVIPSITPRFVLENQWYLSLSTASKILSLVFIGFTYRVKFYTAWYLAQTSVNLTGLSFSPKGNYDEVLTGSLLFEIEPNTRKKTEHWNSSIQVWLRIVFYEKIS